jgi:hypothetical protein
LIIFPNPNGYPSASILLGLLTSYPAAANLFATISLLALKSSNAAEETSSLVENDVLSEPLK